MSEYDTSVLRAELSREFRGRYAEEFDVEGEFSEVDFGGNSEHTLVGHGKQTNAKCGKFKHFLGCLNVELHNIAEWTDLYGNRVSFKNKIFSKPIYHSCDKPSCPICYRLGWSVREAVRMEKRSIEASKRLGLPVEHIVVSVPKRLYGLSLEKMRVKARKAMMARGVVGGSVIVHMFRYRNRRVSKRLGLPVGWYFSPHLHALAFIGGSGYAQCRDCKDYSVKCRGCSGFEGVTRREFDKDGFIVKVLGARKTVGGTCWYQLTHCSIKRGSEKSHAVSWFGVVSYRKMKIEKCKQVVKHRCPLCGGDLVRVRYLGDFKSLHLDRRGQFTPFYGEDGKPLWEIVVGRKFEDG